MNFFTKSKLTRFLMQLSVLQLLLISWMTAVAYAGKTDAQDLMKQPVNLHLDRVPLKKALSEIESRVNIRFAYSRNMIPIHEQVSVVAADEPLSAVLDKLLAPLHIDYGLVNGQIMLKRSRKTASQGPTDDTFRIADMAPEFSSKPADRTISGTVKSETGEGLPGVSVVVKNTTRGTTTDAEGKYRLNIPDAHNEDPGTTLVFSFVGYINQEVVVGSRSSVDVQLTPDTKALGEVVVVGYGTQQKKDLTGAVTTLKARDIGERQSIQVSDALQGAMAGVTVTRNSGGPGSSSTIRVRGITTIGNNDALVIVDGVPYDNIDKLNPNDIETITVLKDAASAAIYGSRAAAGVVLVTTKRAANGQSSVEYTAETGFQTPTQRPEFVDAVRYMQLFNEYRTNDGSTPFYGQNVIDTYWDNHRKNPDLYPATDWQDVVFKQYAPRQRHDLSFTIGTEKIKTRASLNYSQSDGLYTNRSFNRFTVKINNDLQVSKLLSANLDVSYIRGYNVASTGENPINNARLLPGVYAAVYQDGRWAPGKDGRNPLAQITDGGTNKSYENLISGRLAFTFKPLKGLTFTSVLSPTFGFDKSKAFSKVIRFTDLDDPSRIVFTNQPNTTLNETRVERFIFNGQLLANYTTQLGTDHQIDFLAGYEENYASYESVGASRGSFALTDFPYLDLGSTALRDNSGTANEAALRSMFGRFKYDYRSKYYLQANIRRDGSSRFNKNQRWGVFPSFSAGWTLSEESFLKNSRSVSFLKLRGSWGQVGNERIGNYPYQASIIFADALFYKGGQISSETRGAQRQYAVPDISWETTESVDLGVDLGLFNGKLNLAADVYTKKTKDILLMLDIPVYLGFGNPNQNAGIVRAKGWDLEANWKDSKGGFRYSVGVNLSDVKTKIVDLKGTQMLGNQAQLEGGEFNEWFGYRSAGLFQTAEDVKVSPVLNSNTKPGDVRYVDINNDGKITSDGDRVLLGGSLPRYTYGGTIRLDYKGVDFTLVAQGVGKILSRLSDVQVKPFLAQYGNVPTEIDGKFWSPTNSVDQNHSATYPRLSAVSESSNYAMSNFWLINGSYARVKNLTLGYTLPATLLNRIKIKGVRAYVSANDLFTFSKFPTGWDPEVDVANYPIVKTFIAGITLKL